MRPEDLNYSSKLIHRKARFLARKLEFADVDRSDIEHDLLIDVLKRFPAFNPERAKATTFIARIVEHGIASLIRTRRAAKRDARKSVGLPDKCDLTPDEVDDIKARCRRGIPVHDPIHQSDLQHDLETAISAMSPDLQVLCALLFIEAPISEISRLTGRPRTSLHSDIHRIRKHFDDAGLRDYL
ncbi:MAG: sigma factor [Phycisphaerae bacterium]